MKKERKQYNSLFMENAVTLNSERKNASGLAHELGVSTTLVYRRR